ncbi:hypothetical protein HOS59_gp23 [Streptomyces phage Rowa]|uniref:Uncharacterized protein n=1 Tax=Streptomyces phage Rowa TaxID=2059883 RepID=A0A2H5BLV1_9CAUD|nr:hypothetical protein HOS59_gp23 [Streptomyces phage Rowa]AUG87287.1 hypothetical protein SEA_ROWA_23 [Streptomyces phage Rowa]
MGDHSAPDGGFLDKAARAVSWFVANRRKIYAVVVVAIPLVSRVWPDFPADALLDAARIFLGA